MSDRYSVSGALAAFASGVRAEHLPEDVVHQAVRCLVDWLGCTLAGSATPESGSGPRRYPCHGPRRVTCRGHRRHSGAQLGRPSGAGERHRRTRAGLRRHLQSRSDHHPRQRSAVAGDCRGGGVGPRHRQARCRSVRRRLRGADPGRDRRGTGTLRRRLARNRHRRTHRRGGGHRTVARPVTRADAGGAGHRRHPVGGHESRLRVDGQVATRGQGRDGRDAVRFPRPRRLHIGHRTNRRPSRFSRICSHPTPRPSGRSRASATSGICRATASSRMPAAR